MGNEIMPLITKVSTVEIIIVDFFSISHVGKNFRYLHSLLLAIIALSAVQSYAQTFIRNAIRSMFIDTSDNFSYNQVHWLIRTPYLSIIANNALTSLSLFIVFIFTGRNEMFLR